MKFLIVVEESKTGFSAYSPDLPGCVATGSTRERCEKAMKDAVEFHLEGMRSQDLKVPTPKSYSTYVEVPS